MKHRRRALDLRTTFLLPLASLAAFAIAACAPADDGGEPLILAAPVEPAPPARAAVRSGPHDAAAIAEHLADPSAVRWISAHELLGAGTQGCIDGRETSPVIGTPGGDAGELVLALAALEQVTGDDVDLDHVDAVFDAYSEEFGRFYLHTDEHALEGLARRLGGDPRFAEVAPSLHHPHVVEELVRRPPPALRAALLDHLTHPEGVGCGHLRLLLQNPEEYGARRELTEAVLRAAFSRGWEDPERVQLVVLHGEHQEGAVVRVVLDHEVHAHTRIPTFAPRAGATEMFVVHPQVSAFMRRENAAFLLEHRGELIAVDVDDGAFLDALGGLAERQLEATSRRLARGLPVHEIRFRGRAPEVVSLASAPVDATLPR